MRANVGKRGQAVAVDRSVVAVDESAELVAAVRAGKVARDRLPALLADAKARGESELVMAILEACRS